MGSRRSHMDLRSASGEVCMSNMSKAGSITFKLPKPLMLNREVWSTTREDKFVLDSVGGSLVPRPRGRRQTSLSPHAAWVRGYVGGSYNIVQNLCSQYHGSTRVKLLHICV